MSEHPGLPDLQSLAAMATELFQALPAAALPLVSGLQPATPAAPIGSVQPSVSGANPQRPQLGRTSETPTLTSPGLDQQLATSPVPNYYFADNASHYPLANLQLDQLVGQASPKDFGLPDENDLRELLATELSVSKFDAPAGSASPAPDSRFYFLDSHAQPALGNKVFGNDPKHGQFAAEHSGFDVNAIRRDFPILSERVNGKPLVWFDNAATTHKPRSVIERVSYFYEHENSNIHRAAHELAARATDAYEGARNKIAAFLGAKTPDEIIFVRGATEGINLLANTFGQQQVGEGDEIIVSQLEHHANIVPWHMLANRVGAKLRVIPVDDTGQILLDEFRKLINGRTKLVSVTQVSNALGTVTPVKEIIDIAHANGVPVIVDGAQSVSHMRVDVQALDADFFVFSGHKVFGPTGIGVVYGKTEHLQKMSPWQGGGNMIADVTFERIIYQDPPNRFEAGTGNIADAVGLGAAIDYVERIGMDRIARYEHDLLAYGTQRLQTIPGVRLVGTAANKASVLSFVLAGYKTEEVGTELNREGIAVRSGHHCAQPILRRFGLETTVRPSFAFYNTCEEIDLLVSVVERLARRSR